MKKITSVVYVMTAAALLSIGTITHAQHAEASTFNHPLMLADASKDMKDIDMKNMKMGDAPTATHHGSGTVKKIDANSGMVTLSHGPIASLNWPAMTMGFKLKDAALVKGIKSGDEVSFDLMQSGDDYVVTRLQPSVK